MPKRIKITAGSLVVDAELNDTRTASAVWDALPIQANGSTWGDEVYFRIPVEAELESGQEVVEAIGPRARLSAYSSVRRQPVRATKSDRPARSR